MNSSKNLTILYLIGDRGLDLTRAEGYKVHVLKIISGLRAKGHKVFLLAVSETPSLPEMEDYAIIRHKYLRLFFHRIFPFTGTLNSINVLRQIIKLNKLHHFDVIHERFGLYSYGGILASRLLSHSTRNRNEWPGDRGEKTIFKRNPLCPKAGGKAASQVLLVVYASHRSCFQQFKDVFDQQPFCHTRKRHHRFTQCGRRAGI